MLQVSLMSRSWNSGISIVLVYSPKEETAHSQLKAYMFQQYCTWIQIWEKLSVFKPFHDSCMTFIQSANDFHVVKSAHVRHVLITHF